MKDIWHRAIGMRVKAVVYKEADSPPPTQLYIVLEGDDGDRHVEIYAYYGQVCWAGGVDPGGVEEIGRSGHGRVVRSWE